jgi:hypothetical protein
MENNAKTTGYINREITWHAQNDHIDDRLLATFHTARGKKLPLGKLWSVRKKNSASELKVGKNICFLISEMEGRRIRNPKNIISEALRKFQKVI